MERAKKRIAILGGGISGLAAAYEINKAIQAENLPFEFIVLEKRSKLGGMARTWQLEGEAIDVGTSSFDTRRADMRPFLNELGLSEQIEYNINEKPSRYTGQSFFVLEKPTYHGLPFYPKDIFFDRELAFHDKLAILLNRILKKRKNGKGKYQTAFEFIEQRFSEKTANLLAYPYYSENSYGSMELCPPEFFDPRLLEFFGEQQDETALKGRLECCADGPGQEYHFREGMEVLIEKLGEKTADSIETGKEITGITRDGDQLLLLQINDSEEIRVGSIISTLPLQEARQLLKEEFGHPALFPKPSVTGTGSALFQFPKNALSNFPAGSSFVIPKRSSYHITKAIFLNKKWSSLAQSSFDSLVVEFGRRQEDALIQLPDEVILSILEKELKEILKIKEEKTFARVFRWEQAVPHFSNEERQSMEKNMAESAAFLEGQGLFIGGNGLRGYGLPNAIEEGRQLAQAAVRYMRRQNGFS